MDHGEFWELGHVGDRELQHELTRLLASSSRTEARIIAHLVAVEERRLHLEAGNRSMFDYCCRRLGLSESEAFHRLTAARLARRFPAIFGLLERRAIHLTAVCLLRDHLTPENHRQLLEQASGMTKLQVLELLARRFPRPDVASTIRKLPAPRDVPAQRSLSVTADTTAVSESGFAQATHPMPSITTHAANSGTNEPRSEAPTSKPTLPSRNVVVEPLAVERYRIQLNASPRLKEKLEHARDLLSHANPSGDLAAVIERALDLLIERTLKDRFAQTKRPRQDRRADDETSSNAKENPKSVLGDTRHRRTRRPHIANATKREIAARDGLRCTFVGRDGQRCGSTQFTQIHHEQPWAHHGDESPGNLRILCAPHNRLLAERDFGRELVAKRIQSRRVSPGASQAGPSDAEQSVSR